LRFVVSTYPYSGAYLVRLGRKRWAIEGFFKTAKHQFGLHCFGQGTKIGVYRWLILSLIAYLLAHWIDQWSWPPVLSWKATSRLALETLFPSIVWFQLLRQIRISADIAAKYGGCDLNLIQLKGERKTILVELIPELTPTSRC
jgi:hypothetical protein